MYNDKPFLSDHYDRRLQRTLSRYGKFKSEIHRISNSTHHNSSINQDLKEEKFIQNSNGVMSNCTDVVDSSKNDIQLSAAISCLPVDQFDNVLDQNFPNPDGLVHVRRNNEIQPISMNKKYHNKIDFFVDSNDKTYDKLRFTNSFKGVQSKDRVKYYNLNRRNQGFIWRWTKLKFAKNYDGVNYEPWPVFTHFLIAIELIIMAIIIYSYGFTHFGSSQKKVSEIIWHQTNSYQAATYYEHPNIWFGPSYAGLIYEGAKFTPCMRKDKNIMKSIEQRKYHENESGCCIRSDMSGCVQTLQSGCSNKTSFWIKWSNKPGPVCGLDPKYCLDNSSKESYSKNITDWPICQQLDFNAAIASRDLHMKCLVKAHPCCIGIYGKCILASKEYCRFIKGKYHPDASLCSQVDCIEDVCGSFLFPYQLHRLFLSLFIHAGLIQLAINIFVQYVYMRRLEQLLGKWRIIILFFVSGFGGNLASAVFLPVTPDVGPNASLFGLTSFLLYEMFKQRKCYEKPLFVISKIIIILIILFLPALFLSFVDFYSIFFGFLFGTCTMILIHPRVQSKTIKIVIITFLIFMTLSLMLLFFIGSDFIEKIQTYTNKLNCMSLPLLNFNCSNIDIAYNEIKALN